MSDDRTIIAANEIPGIRRRAQSCIEGGGWEPDLLEVADLLAALDTIEVQAVVIDRLQAGWLPQRRADGQPAWRMNGYYPPKWLPMEPAEQQIVYGVVLERQPCGTPDRSET